MSVTLIQYLGEEAYKLENERFEAIIVPKFGSNLLSFRDKKTNRSILRSPKNLEEYQGRPMLFGNPILFPPNRIQDGTFTFEGRTYQFDINRPKEHNHIHGFVNQVSWDVADVFNDGHTLVTVYRSLEHPDVMRQFPHPFVLFLSTSVTDDGVRQELTVQNTGTERFPFGLGFHTTFTYTTEDRFSFDPKEEWILGDRMLPTGERVEVKDRDEWKKGRTLDGMKLDTPYLAGSHQASIFTADCEIRFTVSDSYKHWVIFNGSGQDGFLCIEPYTWITNAPNLSLPREVTGLRVLDPGAEETFVTSIRIIDK